MKGGLVRVRAHTRSDPTRRGRMRLGPGVRMRKFKRGYAITGAPVARQNINMSAVRRALRC
jgi:hypothetical protein